nr:nuclease A inhibitor family protein [Hymenobacter busanensis]
MQELAEAIAAQVSGADGASVKAASSPAPHAAEGKAAKAGGKQDPALEQLELLTKDLLFLSESESPLTVVSYDAPSGEVTPKDVLKLLDKPADTKVDVQDLMFFLRNHTADDGVLGNPDLANRYKALQMYLKQELENTQVYRVGTGPQLEAYALGKTSTGKLAGFKVTLVET